MVLDTQKHEKELNQGWQDVVREKDPTRWVLYGYEGQTDVLKIVGRGEDENLNELIDRFSSGHIQYGFTRVHSSAAGRDKFLIINWVGESVPESRKAMCASHVRDLERFIRCAHITMTARNESDIEIDEIVSYVEKCEPKLDLPTGPKPQLPAGKKPVPPPIHSNHVASRQTTPKQPAITSNNSISSTNGVVARDVVNSANKTSDAERTRSLVEERERFWKQNEEEERQRRKEADEKRKAEQERIDRMRNEQQKQQQQPLSEREKLLHDVASVVGVKVGAGSGYKNQLLSSNSKPGVDPERKKLEEDEKKRWEQSQREAHVEDEERRLRSETSRQQRLKEAQQLVGQRITTPKADDADQRPRFGSTASNTSTSGNNNVDPERARQLDQERQRFERDQREAMNEDHERRNRSEALRQQRQAEAQQLVKQRSTAFDAAVPAKLERKTSTSSNSNDVDPQERNRVDEERRRWQQSQREALDEQKERQQRADQQRQQRSHEAAELVRLGRQESAAGGGGGVASNRALASKFESIASESAQPKTSNAIKNMTPADEIEALRRSGSKQIYESVGQGADTVTNDAERDHHGQSPEQLYQNQQRVPMFGGVSSMTNNNNASSAAVPQQQHQNSSVLSRPSAMPSATTATNTTAAPAAVRTLVRGPSVLPPISAGTTHSAVSAKSSSNVDSSNTPMKPPRSATQMDDDNYSSYQNQQQHAPPQQQDQLSPVNVPSMESIDAEFERAMQMVDAVANDDSTKRQRQQNNNNAYSNSNGVNNNNKAASGDHNNSAMSTAKKTLRARALWDYDASDETEISFDPGEIITDVDTDIDPGWWQGRNEAGAFGLFPANYVELIK